MTKNENARSPFLGSLQRRSLLKLIGTSAITMAGSATPAWQAFAQRRPDDPVDCAPPGVEGKTAVAFRPNPQLPIRMRKSAFDLSKAEVDRLKAAYAALRKLTSQHSKDPRGWLQQGHVHCWYCGGGSNGGGGEEIHGSWLFFPWHRAFLYFHERILCKLLNDDTLALPYWDWDSQGRQTFPAIYGDPNNRSNPLYDLLRSAKSTSRIPSSVVSTRVMNLTMNAPTNNLFMGSRNGSSGAMENQPHGPVHVWTGDTTLRSGRNDMGVLSTAAQDPVFFSHHGNIDRLWSVWLKLSAQHKNFTDQPWLTHGWEFYDENSVWTRIAISDVVDPVNSLRCDYQPPSVKPIWTFTQRPPANAIASAEAQPALTAQSAAATTALGSAPVTQSIALPPPVAEAIAGLTPEAAPEYVLHIEGIEVPPTAQTLFQVYLNLPDANANTGVDVPNFVGMVTILAKNSKGEGHAHPSTNAAFDITEALAKVAKARANSLTVTLVPAAAEGVMPTAQGASFKKIYIDRF
jgi:polyphenol oxidase